jgi:hypothetical protein
VFSLEGARSSSSSDSLGEDKEAITADLVEILKTVRAHKELVRVLVP